MIERILQQSIDGGAELRPGWVPAEHVSRDAWQGIAEDVVLRVRRLSGRPAFGLGEAEVSVHYHRPAGDFARLIRERLGLPPG